MEVAAVGVGTLGHTGAGGGPGRFPSEPVECDLEWALHRSSLEMSCDLYVGKVPALAIVPGQIDAQIT
eukprot:5622826-Pyramimonas_sp.AAC.1